jgi:acetoin utilization protein AcuB
VVFEDGLVHRASGHVHRAPARVESTEDDHHVKRPPTLKTAMTPFPYSVDIDAPLFRAWELMQEHDVRHLPVTDGHRPVGMITDRDLPAGVNMTVRDLEIPEPYVVDLYTPIDNVLLTMARTHVDAVIVTRHGKLAGVFTMVDACRCFGEFIRSNFSPPGGNDVA